MSHSHPTAPRNYLVRPSSGALSHEPMNTPQDVVVGPSLRPNAIGADRLDRRRKRLDVQTRHAMLNPQANESDLENDMDTFKTIEDFLKFDLKTAESPKTRDARVMIETDWLIYHIERTEAAAAKRQKASLNASSSTSQDQVTAEMDDLLLKGGLPTVSSPTELVITKDSSHELLWSKDLVHVHSPRWLVWKVLRTKPIQGRQTVKSRTLLGWLSIFCTCVIHYVWTDGDKNAGKILLTQDGLYTTLRDVAMSLITKYKLDRYHDPPLFFDKPEIQLMLIRLLESSDKLEATRLNAVMTSTLALMSFVLAFRPGSLGPTHEEYRIEGKIIYLKHVTIYKIRVGKFSMRLEIRNFKGNNAETGVQQIYNVESLELPHNITFDLVMHMISYLFMMGYLDPKYKSITDVLDETSSVIALNSAQLEAPLFREGLPGGRGLGDKALMSIAISQKLSSLANAVNLPKCGVYAMRHATADAYYNMIGKEGAQIVLNHVVKDTFFSHYSRTVSNFNYALMRLGEIKSKTQHYFALPSTDHTRAAVFAVISRARKVDAALAEPEVTTEEITTLDAQMDQLWDNFTNLFNESQHYYLDDHERSVQIAQQMETQAREQSKSGHPSAGLEEAGYGRLICSDPDKAKATLTEMYQVTASKKRARQRALQKSQWDEDNNVTAEERAVKNLDSKARNEAKANDPELQALNIQAQNLWSQFLPLFNEGQTFPPYSRDADTRDSTLAKKFVNDANDISKQSKAFRKKCPDGLKWIDPVAGPPLGEQIYAQLKTLNDSMISARRKCVKKLKNDSNKKIRKDYIGGSVQASWTEIQVAGQAVKAQDNIATSIVDQVNTVSAGQVDDTLDNDTVDEDELADFDDKTSSVRKGLQALLNFNGIQSAYKALDGMRTERAPEHDSDIVIEDRFDMRMRESVEKEIVCKHLPEIAALPIDDVQRQFVVYLVTPWLREKMLKSAKIQETGQYKCQWCPIVPWHPINPPIFNREHRGKLKRHIFKEHNPWKELERLIEYQPDKFHCPSLDFEGPSSDKVREHMLKDCKDREQYQKLAADAKVEPDDADVEWESSVEVEEGDDLNLTAKTLGPEASMGITQALANLLYGTALI